MPTLKVKLSVVAGIVLAVLAAIGFYVVLPRINHPEPDVHGYHIAAGGVSRAIAQDKTNKRRGGRRRGPPLSYLPNHIDFESTAGASVYVVRYPTGSARQQVEEMQRLTDELKAGKPPQKLVAQGSGDKGRIRINWQPYGEAKYLILVRCEQESEVTLVVHYGP